MTPQEAHDHLSARRTDAPTRYALAGMTADFAIEHNLSGGLALHTATEYIDHADRAEMEALRRSLDDPMPADLTERILNALKEEAGNDH